MPLPPCSHIAAGWWCIWRSILRYSIVIGSMAAGMQARYRRTFKAARFADLFDSYYDSLRAGWLRFYRRWISFARKYLNFSLVIISLAILAYRRAVLSRLYIIAKQPLRISLWWFWYFHYGNGFINIKADIISSFAIIIDTQIIIDWGHCISASII